MNKKIALFVFFFLLIISIFGLVKYYVFTQNYVKSDAVFVKSDTLTNLSFKLPGKIERVYVNEGDSVKKGTLLAKLDTKNLEIHLKEVNFSIKALNKEINALNIQKEKLAKDIEIGFEANKNDLLKLKKEISSASYEIDALKPQLNKLKSDYEKFKKLYKEGKTSKEKFERVKVAYLSFKDKFNSAKEKFKILLLKQKDLQIQKENLKNKRLEIKRLALLIKAKENKLKALKEKLSLINQNIKDSYLYMPFNGSIAKKFAKTDEIVDAGQRVLSVVNLKDVYILDLLDEKKLYGIKKGCRAKIHIDALNRDFYGVVEKILPASAATFALVPRDISSGEFTKLSQRFYVRLRFIKVPSDVKVGMSGEVQIAKCNLH